MKKQNNHITPPRLAERFLLWFLKRDLAEEVLGDLDEKFRQTVKRRSLFRARLNYWFQVLNYMRLFAIKRHRSTQVNGLAMFRHNVLISFRGFKRQKSTFLINLFGLTTGLASALLIYLWVDDELHMDQFNEKDSDRHYQVFENTVYPDGIVTSETTSNPLAEALAESFPEVEYGIRVIADPFYTGVLSSDDQHLRARANFVSQRYFDVFRCDFVAGNKANALSKVNDIVISEKLANGLFGGVQQALGKTVTFKHKFFNGPYTVTGVFSPVDNSSTKYDVLFSYDSFLTGRPDHKQWWSGSALSYIVLNEGVDLPGFNAKIKDFLSGFKETEQEIFAQRYSEKYLYGNYKNGTPIAGRIIYVRIFSLIAIFVLVIAGINYHNLSMAQASRRVKEIGIKKAIGAQRKLLIYQFFSESLCITFLSLIVAMVTVSLFLPQFNEITGKQLSIHDAARLSLPIVGIAFLTAIISGVYPGLYLSAFRPVIALKGKVSGNINGLWLRKGLIVFQFAISAVLIISLIITYKQMNFIQTANLGYATDHIISFRKEGSLAKEDEVFMSEIRNTPGVVNMAFLAGELPDGISRASGLRWNGQSPEERHIPFDFIEGGHGLAEVMGVELLEGRFFSRNFPGDKNAVILNETAVERIGYKSPVGQPFWAWKDCKIIGVVKDFHFKGMQEQIEPLFFLLNSNANTYLAKIESQNQTETIGKIKGLYTQFNPGYPFGFKFLDEGYQALYDEENRIATLSKYFAGIAIAISCLGLLALTTFSTRLRLKEIAIRKVLGSRSLEVAKLLSIEFITLVFAGIIIALPIGYLLAQNWLNGFAYRIALSPAHILLPGVAMMLLAWLIIMSQVSKTTRMDITKTLRSE